MILLRYNCPATNIDPNNIAEIQHNEYTIRVVFKDGSSLVGYHLVLD